MIYILIITAIVLADTMIKNYIEHNKQLDAREDILKGKVTIHKHYNYGMMLNFMDDRKKLVKIISATMLGILLLLFAIFLPRKGNRLFKLGLSFILGGAIGNVYDRVKRGYVVDYFSINCGKLRKLIFNLSDFFIFIGSIITMIASIFFPKNDMREEGTSYQDIPG